MTNPLLARLRARTLREGILHYQKVVVSLREAAHEDLWDTVKRVRARVKGIYGDDSSQYEMVGGTRLSEGKTVRRTATPA